MWREMRLELSVERDEVRIKCVNILRCIFEHQKFYNATISTVSKLMQELQLYVLRYRNC